MKQYDLARFGKIDHVLAVLRPAIRQFRRRRHEFAQARIFKFQTGTTLWGPNVIDAADHREWMQMKTVGGLARHDVYPAIGHAQFASLQVHLEMPDERSHVSTDLPFKLHERGRELVQVVERAV